MRYALTSVSGPGRRAFKEGIAYDDRDITRLARREGLYVTRPNGSQRIRGSSRLIVWSGDKIVARFERHNYEESKAPVPVATLKVRGTLI